ncbi:uncharacterized protein HMPREF1541_10155 [Cyphellophora europaea CBS 101466]|uniref:GH16 domain-containing protein n=1 Tax=Cyphellophora europaea (strain CBS 101466) TaxID=1220924 RepID=W2S785_CYPE1|nr:uncharacterized protein HMPREF1541_10155 [Cyphellophora europaea CBS 101466]ETN44485.1 hypothetical protein HMPREF1541_10155 [Cyphellophora europaea CBS 101466]
MLLQVLYTKFKKPFWQRGNFPLSMSNGTAYVDPWTKSGGSPSTPFDQPFYLILNVAVGGSDGWFQDGKDGKPWVDNSRNARVTIWNDREKWVESWKDAMGRGLAGSCV